MSIKEFVISMLLVFLYFLLFGLASNLVLSGGSPSWWTHSIAGSTTVGWIKLSHYFGLLVGAIPVALIVILSFRSAWLRMTWIVTLLASLGALIIISYGLWQARNVPEFFEYPWIVISIVDILAVGAVFLGVAILTRKAVPYNNALRLPH